MPVIMANQLGKGETSFFKVTFSRPLSIQGKQCIPRKGCLVAWGEPNDVIISAGRQVTMLLQTTYMQSYDRDFSAV